MNLCLNKITPEYIDSQINKVEYTVVGDGRITICIITVKNGFQFLGQSACDDPANFDKDKGEKYAYENARESMWAPMGYALKQKLWEARCMKTN